MCMGNEQGWGGGEGEGVCVCVRTRMCASADKVLSIRRPSLHHDVSWSIRDIMKHADAS